VGGERADVIGSDTDADGPASPVRRRAAVVLLAVAAGAGVLADRQVRDAEFDALLEQAVAGQAAIRYADGRIGATVQYASPVLGSSQTQPHVRASLEGIVEAEAGQQVEVLRRRQAESAAVRIWPWHAEQRAARRAYAAYLSARVDYLEAVAADFDALYGRPPELARRLAQAAEAYDEAAPSRGDALTARELLLGRVRGSVTLRVSP
jgi:hypothetical protein